jgi:ketosteroid isomerase-like protein
MSAQFVFAAVMAVVGPAAVAGDVESDRRDILRVEAELCRAFETADVDALREGLDATFTLTDSKGVVTDLDRNLDEVASREPTYEVFRNHSQSVRLYGDAAIVTGVTHVQGLSAGQRFTADFQFTDTWVRRGDGWKMAASHASRLPSSQP